MTLVDSNVWLALAIPSHPCHHVVGEWLTQQTKASVLFCRPTQLSVLRLLTTQAILAAYGVPPLSNKGAWAAFASFRADPRVGWIEEPEDLETQWKKWTTRATASPKLWMDAYLAAFAFSSNCRLATTDLGFKQFKGLDLVVLTANECQ